MNNYFYQGERFSVNRKLILLFWSMVIVLTVYSKDHSFINTEAPEIYVNDIGANGNDKLNDTWAFQKAIDSLFTLGGGTVKALPGKYYIDVDANIRMKSNVTLDLVDTTRQLIAIPTYSGKYKVVFFSNVHDAAIIGGKIIGERKIHLGSECPGQCEQGYGVNISTGCSNIKVIRTYIQDCWGDGMGVSGKNITLSGVTCFNNRRQGLSVFIVDGLLVDSCSFLYTQGTAPQDGIDIEPDSGTAQNITITNCYFSNNKGNGIECNAKTTTTAVIKNVIVKNNTIEYSTYAAYLQHASNVQFYNNILRGIQYGPNVKGVDCVNSVLLPNYKATSLAFVISEYYQIDQTKHTIVGPLSSTTLSDFYAKLYPSFGVTMKVLDINGNESKLPDLNWGDKLLATAADGQTINIYEISVDLTEVTQISENIKMYPNPTTDKVMINGLTVGNRVQVFNADGVTVHDQIVDKSTDNVSLLAQPTGIYVFVISSGGKLSHIQKIIKK